MSDLEIVLALAWLVTLFLWHRSQKAVNYLRGTIIGVGLGKIEIEVDDENYRVYINHK